MTVQTTTKADLLLLGLVLDRPMHGYELYQQIQSEGIDGWFNISAAGVYYSLRKLRDQELVAESRQQGGRSSRKSIYRSTDRGRTAFFAAMDKQLTSRERSYLDFDLATYLLNKLPVQRALSRLEEHQAFLSEQLQEVQTDLANEGDNGHSPLKLAILDHRQRFLEMEQTWLTGLIGEIHAGREEAGSTEDKCQDLMVLRGDLRRYHLPDFIRLIVAGKHRGTLTIVDGSETGTLSFDQGQPIYASCVMHGQPPIPMSSLDEVIEGLCDLFRRQEGRIIFDQRIDRQEWWLPIGIGAEEFILRGCRKVESWSIIQRLVPSAATIFEAGPGAQHLAALRFLPNEDQVLAAVDGVKDVTTIARELDLTQFEASRVFYCLTAIGALRAADENKALLRRVFREIAELMCSSTLAWRASPDDRTCEKEVNRRAAHLPLRLDDGRIQDQAKSQLGTDNLRDIYLEFLRVQFSVIGEFFGHSNAREAYRRTLSQLAPELQSVAKRYDFDRLPAS